MALASGKWALAVCDICGFTCEYTDLKDYIYNQRPNGLRVCPSCFDIDNEQLQIGKNQIPEAIALWKPRPDANQLTGCRGFFGWMPVIGLQAQVTLNPVTVSTS